MGEELTPRSAGEDGDEGNEFDGFDGLDDMLLEAGEHGFHAILGAGVCGKSQRGHVGPLLGF